LITGAEKAAHFIVGGIGKAQVALTGQPTVVDGGPAPVLRVDDEIDGVQALRVEDPRISGRCHVRDAQNAWHPRPSLTLR